MASDLWDLPELPALPVYWLTDNETRPFGCWDCKRRFPTLARLNSHLRWKHYRRWVDFLETVGRARVLGFGVTLNGRRVYLCTRCSASAESRSNLRQHDDRAHVEGGVP